MSGKETVVPLPEVVVGQLADDSGTKMADGLGNQVTASAFDAIMSAIYAVAQEFRDVSITIGTTIESLTTDVAALTTAITTLSTSVGALITAFEGATGLTPAQVSALEAADTAVKAATSTLTTETVAVTQATTPTAPAA